MGPRGIRFLVVVGMVGVLAAVLPIGAPPALAVPLLQDCLETKDPGFPCTDTPEPKPTDTKEPTPEPTETKEPGSTNTPVPPSDTPKATDLGATVTSTPSPTRTFPPLIAVLPDTATPMTYEVLTVGDIWVTGMEVTQAMQIYGSGALDNTVPLVAYKRTVVRVYVQSREDAAGPWNDVTARLEVTGSSRPRVHLPATIDPRAAIVVSPSGSSRARLADSFNFLLDLDETAPGERTFTVRISSIGRRAESNPSNNSATLTLRFHPMPALTMYGVPYGNDGSLAASPRATPPPFSDFEGHRRFTLNVFPVADFLIAPYYASTPFYFANHEAAKSWADRLLARPSMRGTRLYLLQPEGSCGCGEAAPGGRMNGHNERDGLSIGQVMAQEAAHSFGGPGTILWQHAANEHGAPDPIPGFPYAHDTIGPQVGMNTHGGAPGFAEPGTSLLRTVPGTSHVHDILSYGGPPLWSSPFTYCALLQVISRGSVVCPAGANMAGLTSGRLSAPARAGDALSAEPDRATLADFASGARQSDTRLIYVAGRIHADGSADFEPFETWLGPASSARWTSGATYTLVFQDASRKELASFAFEITSTHPHADEPARFDLLVPFDEATDRIALMLGDKVLVERSRSEHPPEIEWVEAPEAGVWTGLSRIAWQGSDVDGDDLTYAIEYSADSGRTWLPLTVGLAGSSLDVDFDVLPSSQTSLLRVLASDGVNTTEMRSPAEGSVPPKDPIVRISEPFDGSQFYQGQPFWVEATAYDVDEGPLGAHTAYTWSSDLDGALGSGPWLVPDGLSVGVHRLTVIATDKTGAQGEASIEVTILAAPEFQGPAPAETGRTVPPALAAVAGAAILVAGIVGFFLLRRRAMAKQG